MSGYVIENGPGVWVRLDGCIYPSPKFLVSRRSGVRFAGLGSRPADGGIGVLGEAFPIATAYAFESVLNAVGELGSMSAFKAVDDLPKVCAAAGVLIWSDNLGLLGGDELGTWRDMAVVDCVRVGTSIVDDTRMEMDRSVNCGLRKIAMVLQM